MKRLFAATSILLFAAAMAPAEPVAEHPTGSRTTPPTIESLAPRGVSQGATAVLTVEGYNLRGASAVHFSEPTVSGRLLEVKEMPYVAEPPRLGPAGLPSTVDLGPQPPRYQVRLEVTVDEKADVAPVRFRLATEFGTSPAGKILIEPRYHVDSEGEPGHETDSTADDPRKSSLPAILAGVISEPGDEDYFAITVEAGQELVFEEGGMKIGSKIKPIIDLLAADHTPVRLGGKNRSRAGRAFAHRFDKAGTYFVRVSDYEKSGSKDHFYRVKVGDYPLVESAYPLGVRRGETTTAALKGFNLGDGKVTVRGEPSWMDDRRAVVRPETEKGRAFNAVKLALGDHPEVEASGENTEVSVGAGSCFPGDDQRPLGSGFALFPFRGEEGPVDSGGRYRRAGGLETRFGDRRIDGRRRTDRVGYCARGGGRLYGPVRPHFRAGRDSLANHEGPRCGGLPDARQRGDARHSPAAPTRRRHRARIVPAHHPRTPDEGRRSCVLAGYESAGACQGRADV